MSYEKLRTTFTNFFQKNQHILLPPSKLVLPPDKSNLFFTNSGMSQFKKYFTLEELSPYKRVVTIQGCIRAGGKHNDLENVGYTARHHTFFEMMGNFSFYDYFKEEAISYAIEFLTKELLISPKKLFFTVHANDEDAYNLFRKFTDQPILRLDTNDNFWSMGELGPCGYCGEIYYYIGDKDNPTSHDFLDSFNSMNPEFLEIWNLVFMEFNQTPDGRVLLNKKSIDTGMGLERVLSILEGKLHNYKTSIVAPLVEMAKSMFQLEEVAARIVADHIKSTVFLLNEKLKIGNEGASYVLRKIIRRALNHMNLKVPAFYKLAVHVKNLYKGIYEFKHMEEMEQAIFQEETLYINTISGGMNLLENSFATYKPDEAEAAATVFKLYETHGLPLDFSKHYLQQQGIDFNQNIFNEYMEDHRKKSGSTINMNFDFVTKNTAHHTLKEKAQVVLLISNGQLVDKVQEGEEFLCVTNISPFYARGGGQEGDQGLMSKDGTIVKVLNTTKKNQTTIHHCQITQGCLERNDEIDMEVNKKWRDGTTMHHTATHILHALLQKFLSPDIQQKGSLINDHKLRFDFNFSRPLTAQEKEQIQNAAKEICQKNIKVNILHMPYETAMERGAEFLQDTSYEKEVRVIDIPGVSLALCGGTHLHYTGTIQDFTITSDKGIGSNTRRLEVKCQ